MNINQHIPTRVLEVINLIKSHGHEAYIVGGSIRDILMGNSPKDWDITTNALPEVVTALFESKGFRAVYENSFGTVGIVFEEEEVTSPTREIEITTYRTESGYYDSRHPSEVTFVSQVHDDLARRDFSMNAIAYDPTNDTFVDPFDGVAAITSKTIVCVGNAQERFTEDALRILRMIRFTATLGFTCESSTLQAAQSTMPLIANISQERIRDEFIKILVSNNPGIGIMFLVKLGAMEYIMPELLEGDKCEQKGEHVYDVMNHLIYAMQHAADKGYPFHVRLAALLHDIGKPRTRRYAPEKDKYTFYGHEVVGAKMARKILERMKFPKETIQLVENFVRWHMFFSDPELITLSAVRRIIRNVGKEHIWDLMKVRECDRVGMKKQEAPYRLRKYFAMIEEVLHDPIDVKMLKINGDYMISTLHMKPGRRMGWVLHALLEEVIEDPQKNELTFLVKRVEELDTLTDAELQLLGEEARETKEQAQNEQIDQFHAKHRVQNKKTQ